MDKDCVFCNIAIGKIPSKKICENDNFFSISDANPKIKGHSLVISKKHFVTLLDLPSSLGQEMIDCAKETAMKLMKENKSGGFNLVNNNFKVAGQIVNHFHMHVIPRKDSDGFKLVG